MTSLTASLIAKEALVLLSKEPPPEISTQFLYSGRFPSYVCCELLVNENELTMGLVKFGKKIIYPMVQMLLARMLLMGTFLDEAWLIGADLEKSMPNIKFAAERYQGKSLRVGIASHADSYITEWKNHKTIRMDLKIRRGF